MTPKREFLGDLPAPHQSNPSIISRHGLTNLHYPSPHDATFLTGMLASGSSLKAAKVKKIQIIRVS